MALAWTVRRRDRPCGAGFSRRGVRGASGAGPADAGRQRAGRPAGLYRAGGPLLHRVPHALLAEPHPSLVRSAPAERPANRGDSRHRRLGHGRDLGRGRPDVARAPSGRRRSSAAGRDLGRARRPRGSDRASHGPRDSRQDASGRSGRPARGDPAEGVCGRNPRGPQPPHGEVGTRGGQGRPHLLRGLRWLRGHSDAPIRGDDRTRGLRCIPDGSASSGR